MPAAAEMRAEEISSDLHNEGLSPHDNNNNNNNGEQEYHYGNKEYNNNNGDDGNIVVEEDEDDENQNQHDVETHEREENSSGDEAEDDNENEKKGEFILVRLADIRKEVQCPICLGIIRKTRTVMECLHRFCRECIDKSMRLGNNECPACRTHCASRRSLRDDPNYDALIAAIYPDIDQYEEEEMSFLEDEIALNIKASIAQTLRRQTEALSKKRKRTPTTYRRRINNRSEDEEEANAHDGSKDSSSADERSTEVKYKRSKRWRGHPSPAGSSRDGAVNEHDQEVRKETMVAPAGLVGSPEMLAWGKGGMRSNTRHGSGAGGNAKNSRNRLAKLGDHLRISQDNESELEIQVVLIAFDKQKSSALQHSFISSKPALSVGQLCQYISLQTSLPPERVEILAAKDPCLNLSSYSTIQGKLSSSCALEACRNDLQVLGSEETLGGLKAATNFYQGHLMLAYREKA